MPKQLEHAPIGELARRSGVNIETIRYYERIGLLPRPWRTASGYRHYGEVDVRRLAFIRRSRELGFSLEQVRELLDLAQDQGRTCAEVRAVAETQLASVRSKLADLRRME